MPYKDKEVNRAYQKAYHQKLETKQRKQEYAKKNAVRFRAYKRDWLKLSQLAKYGLTQQTYAELVVNGCEICGSISKLHLDHDHATGTFRGLLCSNHNLALGLFQDNIRNLQNAIDYLRRNKVDVMDRNKS